MALAPKSAMAIANGRGTGKPSDQAATDPLTGLPTASALFDDGRETAPVRSASVTCDGIKGVKTSSAISPESVAGSLSSRVQESMSQRGFRARWAAQ